jgi:hypothetical protein
VQVFRPGRVCKEREKYLPFPYMIRPFAFFPKAFIISSVSTICRELSTRLYVPEVHGSLRALRTTMLLKQTGLPNARWWLLLGTTGHYLTTKVAIDKIRLAQQPAALLNAVDSLISPGRLASPSAPLPEDYRSNRGTIQSYLAAGLTLRGLSSGA